MIYIDRNNYPRPAIFESESHQRAFDEAQSFFTGKTQVRQKQFDFNWLITQQKELNEHLRIVFHHKCAYCEQSLVGVKSAIDLFRPRHNASWYSNNNFEYYWWLAYEWNNMYLSCTQCNFNKRNLFPIKNNRIEFGQDIRLEEKLLLDPCDAGDFDQKHLVFLRNGMVVSETEEGRVTIDIFGLNRDDLILMRKQALQETESQFLSATKNSRYKEESLYSLFNPEKPFYAAKLMLREYLLSMYKKADQGSKRTGVTDKKIKKISTEYESFKKQQQNYSVEGITEKDQKSHLLESDRWIRRIEIKNFRLIRHLHIDLPSKQPGNSEPWIILLGENGSGKSSILQCVALALMGQSHLDKLVTAGTLDPRDCISYSSRSDYGYIKVFLSDTKKPIEVHFNRKEAKFKSNILYGQFILMGYGSTRLLSKHITESKERFVKIQNLFDPFSPLQNVLRWFSDPTNLPEAQFDNICMLLKKVLPIQESSFIDRIKNENGYELRLFGENNSRKGMPLSQLSSGYQSVIAFILDISLTVIEKFPDVETAQGIVFIDEIETHLHPRWKMKIVSQLRNTFKRLRFIATTHDPLCLRGLYAGEVILVQLDEDKNVHAIQGLPSPSNMRIDELLLSQHFGLSTVYDPSREFLLGEFFTLAAKHNRNKEEEDRLSHLKTQIRTSKILDDTTYQFIEMTSQYFRDNQVGLNKDEIKPETQKAVEEIWKNTLSRIKTT